MKTNPHTHPPLAHLGLALTASLGLMLAGCGKSGDAPHDPDAPDAPQEDEVADEHAHNEEEVALQSTMIADMQVELAQGHGPIKAGKEGHLVVKLPYNDNGATLIRAWIGTEDRMFSLVGKGEYAPAHDDYDIHATAPYPLPENTMWWIEIEKPDGTKVVGSAKPLME